ncbi:lysozyme [Neptunomonas japonica]|uniref:lysozyme n=1 Tax=Neptunomonas japonica TaxID=417574 RepID=UPI00048D5EDD|nr:lysozyme [Neptunomonas japonica]
MNQNRFAVSALTISALGFVSITGYEGYREKAYIPVVGDVPTIGFGTTEGVKAGDTITPERALARALHDVTRFEGALRSCVKVPLHQYEYDAYISLAYNIGSSAFCRSTLVRKLNAGEYSAACEQIKRWSYFKGRKLKGLIKRRNSEYKQCIGN